MSSLDRKPENRHKKGTITPRVRGNLKGTLQGALKGIIEEFAKTFEGARTGVLRQSWKERALGTVGTLGFRVQGICWVLLGFIDL